MHEHIRQDLDLLEATTRPAKLETTPLPYAKDALEPVMSEASIDYHYEHLAKGYARRYNADNIGNSGGDYVRDFNRAGNFLRQQAKRQQDGQLAAFCQPQFLLNQSYALSQCACVEERQVTQEGRLAAAWVT